MQARAPALPEDDLPPRSPRITPAIGPGAAANTSRQPRSKPLMAGARGRKSRRANLAVPCAQRIELTCFIADLSAGYQSGWHSVIKLNGGGSPTAMKQ